MPTPLPSKKRSELRAEAHKLTPVVIIGDKGLTETVMAEIDRSLKAHELIKVRAASAKREDRGPWIEAICGQLEAHAVQQIGKVFVIYRANPVEKAVRRPAPKPKGSGPMSKQTRTRAKAAGARDDVKGISRPRSRTPSPRPESAPRRRRPPTSR